MYNKYLETFIQVADTGSFTKAAEKLFISSTAVMKQMNSMESELNLSLLNRTKQGITLTDIGRQIYEDAKFIINYSNEALKKATKIQKKFAHSITVGTSMICPCKPLLDIWYKINDKYTEFKVKIIPFEENHTTILNTLKSNGINLDLIVSPCDSKQWLENFNFLKLGDSRFCIAVPNNHKLAQKEVLNYSDLSGEKVMVITGGDSPKNKQVLDNLKNISKNVEIKDAPFFYTLDAFNTCEENGYLLVSLECWKDIHPAFKTIPLSTGESNAYGIIYSKNCSEDTKKFVAIIENFIKK